MNRLWGVLCIGIFLCGCTDNSTTSNQAGQGTMQQSSQMARTKVRRDELLREGINFLSKAELTQAIRSFNQAVREFPDDPEPYFVLSAVYMRLNNYKSAIAGFKNVIRLDPENGRAYYLMGFCYGLSGDRDAAIKALKRSTEIFQKKNDEPGYRHAVAIIRQMLPTQPAAAASSRRQQGQRQE